jgi:hypothetical protein
LNDLQPWVQKWKWKWKWCNTTLSKRRFLLTGTSKWKCALRWGRFGNKIRRFGFIAVRCRNVCRTFATFYDDITKFWMTKSYGFFSLNLMGSYIRQ